METAASGLFAADKSDSVQNWPWTRWKPVSF